jgi:hypothetical protein
VIPTGLTYKTIIFFSLRFPTFLSHYTLMQVMQQLERAMQLGPAWQQLGLAMQQ